jgi:protein O-GlcNAc transferase
LAKQFYARLEHAFARFNLRASDYCLFLPLLSKKQFDNAMQLMDIFLDTLGWSGCNTTFESLTYNLPIVTHPGKTMRSRHTAAILNRMDMSDCVSISRDEYIGRAIELGRFSEERVKMSKRLAAQKSRVYRDRSAITALEELLIRLTDF